MNREDEVAAVVFCRALNPETLDAMKKVLLRTAKSGRNRPDPRTREGLSLIALTTPDIVEPTEEEVQEALSRVRLLLTEEEWHRLGG